MMPVGKIIIIGCGPGSREYLMPAAWAAAKEADVLIGSKRLLDLFNELPVPRKLCPAKSPEAIALIERLATDNRHVGLLVSGDPGVFSLAAAVKRHFGVSCCRVVPGISAVQLAFARLGLDWPDARIISAHGREPDMRPEDLQMISPIAVLCGTQSAWEWGAGMVRALESSHQAWICENLGLPGETVIAAGSGVLEPQPAGSLVIMVLAHRNTEKIR